MPSDPTEISGEALGRGVECQQFRLDTGEQISLSGVDRDGVTLTPGTRFVLNGRWMPMSNCMQGRTFRVTSFDRK